MTNTTEKKKKHNRSIVFACTRTRAARLPAKVLASEKEDTKVRLGRCNTQEQQSTISVLRAPTVHALHGSRLPPNLDQCWLFLPVYTKRN